MYSSQQALPDNIQHLKECDGCERCDFLMGIYLACDGCGEWGHKDSAHRYVMTEGAVICEICQASTTVTANTCAILKSHYSKRPQGITYDFSL